MSVNTCIDCLWYDFLTLTSRAHTHCKNDVVPIEVVPKNPYRQSCPKFEVDPQCIDE